MLAVVAAIFVIAVLSWLVVGSLVGRRLAFWGLVFILAIVVIAGLADWFTREDQSGAEGWARLKSPRWLARAGMSVLFGLGMGLFAQQFIAPTEFDLTRVLLDDLRAGQDETHEKLDSLIDQSGPRTWRARENIAGHWGEEGGDCAVVYRFEHQDDSLTVTLVRKAPSMADYRMTATVAGGEADALRATLRTSTEADETHGQALVFTYHHDGGDWRRLDWLNETRSEAGVLRLQPCEAP